LLLFCKLLNFRWQFLVHKTATFNTQPRQQQQNQDMKYKILIISFLLLSEYSFGQSKFKIGVKTGLTSNKRPYFCDECVKQIIFPTIGLTSYTDLNEKLSVHANLQFVRLGKQSRTSHLGTTDNEERLYYRHFDKLELPFYVNYKMLNTAKIDVTLGLGITPNLFLSGRQLEKPSVYLNAEENIDINPLKYNFSSSSQTYGIVSPMNRTSVQAQFGIGLGFTNKITVDAFYRFGEDLSYAYRKSVPGVIYGSHLENDEFELSLTYWFNL
jgi:hypothetical protein